MTNHNEISSLIWNVCDDILRGLFKQHEYGDVILPFVVLNQLFFNTGISTYIWIVSNNKKSDRKDKVQLIDGSSFYKSMKKSLGDKRKYIDESQRDQLLQMYEKFEENEYSKIYDNAFFGYTRVTIEQPKVENGQVVRDKKGNPKPDSKLRDHERIPLLENIEQYFDRA